MCGRFTMRAPGKLLAQTFQLDQVPELPFRYNIAPTQPVATVFLSMLLLGERPSPAQLLGVLFVIGGIAAATVPVARVRDAWRARRDVATPIG